MTTWRDVYQQVDARRVQLGFNWSQVYEATGVSEKSFRQMRTEGIGLAKAEKLVMICDGLGWTHDSIDLILAGKSPELAGPKPIDPVKQLAAIEHKVDQLMELLLDIARVVLGGGSPPPAT